MNFSWIKNYILAELRIIGGLTHHETHKGNRENNRSILLIDLSYDVSTIIDYIFWRIEILNAQIIA